MKKVFDQFLKRQYSMNREMKLEFLYEAFYNPHLYGRKRWKKARAMLADMGRDVETMEKEVDFDRPAVDENGMVPFTLVLPR